MSVQEDVNAAVEQINDDLSAAQATVLPESITVDMTDVRAAFAAVQAAIQALGASVVIPPIPDKQISIAAIAECASHHINVSAGLIGLLITASNFDGSEQ